PCSSLVLLSSFRVSRFASSSLLSSQSLHLIGDILISLSLCSLLPLYRVSGVESLPIGSLVKQLELHQQFLGTKGSDDDIIALVNSFSGSPVAPLLPISIHRAYFSALLNKEEWESYFEKAGSILEELQV